MNFNQIPTGMSRSTSSQNKPIETEPEFSHTNSLAVKLSLTEIRRVLCVLNPSAHDEMIADDDDEGSEDEEIFTGTVTLELDIKKRLIHIRPHQAPGSPSITIGKAVCGGVAPAAFDLPPRSTNDPSALSHPNIMQHRAAIVPPCGDAATSSSGERLPENSVRPHNPNLSKHATRRLNSVCAEAAGPRQSLSHQHSEA